MECWGCWWLALLGKSQEQGWGGRDAKERQSSSITPSSHLPHIFLPPSSHLQHISINHTFINHTFINHISSQSRASADLCSPGSNRPGDAPFSSFPSSSPAALAPHGYSSPGHPPGVGSGRTCRAQGGHSPAPSAGFISIHRRVTPQPLGEAGTRVPPAPGPRRCFPVKNNRFC